MQTGSRHYTCSTCFFCLFLRRSLPPVCLPNSEASESNSAWRRVRSERVHEHAVALKNCLWSLRACRRRTGGLQTAGYFINSKPVFAKRLVEYRAPEPPCRSTTYAVLVYIVCLVAKFPTSCVSLTPRLAHRVRQEQGCVPME